MITEPFELVGLVLGERAMRHRCRIPSGKVDMAETPKPLVPLAPYSRSQTMSRASRSLDHPVDIRASAAENHRSREGPVRRQPRIGVRLRLHPCPAREPVILKRAWVVPADPRVRVRCPRTLLAHRLFVERWNGGEGHPFNWTFRGYRMQKEAG